MNELFRRASFHEAGHCALIFRRGDQGFTAPQAVTVSTSGNGLFALPGRPGIYDDVVSVTGAARFEKLAPLVQIYMAGSISEWLYSGDERGSLDAGRADADKCVELLTEFDLIGEEYRELGKASKLDVMAYLKENWPKVAAMAQALEAKGTLTGDELQAIFDGS